MSIEKQRYAIEQAFDTVERCRRGKDACVKSLFCFLASDIGAGGFIITEEVEWYFEVWQFFDEMEREIN